MITLTQLATSTEPVQLLVRAIADGQVYNPTGDPVSVAFIPSGEPAPDASSAAWKTAAWETDSGDPPAYWASILVGPLNGGVALAAGTYIAYVKVTDNPAVPIRAGAYLTIT